MLANHVDIRFSKATIALALVTSVAGAVIDCARPSAGGSGTKDGRCEAPLVLVDESIGADAENLPVIAKLEDVGPPDRDRSGGCGAEYGDRYHYRAKLGPLAARYTALDYKGQSISSNTTLSLSSPTCPETEIAFTMAGPRFVRLRRNPARDVYVVTGGILQTKAIAVRMQSSGK